MAAMKAKATVPLDIPPPSFKDMEGAFWRYRVGDCRVICDIQDGALRVLVVQVGNRREVYR
ncbi:MAG: type II toxin-antitoxin system RelE/ParE family toxin [Spirochaetes bacterium]|nr:type II toxin-antitoxin system RelE/ParE family toxin [Spirochaetota bacterium]